MASHDTYAQPNAPESLLMRSEMMICSLDSRCVLNQMLTSDVLKDLTRVKVTTRDLPVFSLSVHKEVELIYSFSSSLR